LFFENNASTTRKKGGGNMKNCKQGLKHDFCIEWLLTGLGEWMQASEWCSNYSVGAHHHRLRCKNCDFVIDEFGDLYEKYKDLKNKYEQNRTHVSKLSRKEINLMKRKIAKLYDLIFQSDRMNQVILKAVSNLPNLK
jgi:hypothetical protein